MSQTNETKRSACAGACGCQDCRCDPCKCASASACDCSACKCDPCRCASGGCGCR